MIRLEEKPLELDGRRYLLRCNMAVLERVEEEHGSLEEFFQLQVRTALLDLLRTMLNEYAEDQGWDVEWTTERLKKAISYSMLLSLDLMGMLFRAITPPEQQTGVQAADAKAAEPEQSGN